MTDNLQLQTARLTNASAGNLLDDSVADIENAMSVVFGITKDTPLSQVMSISAAGDVTMIGDLTLAGAPTNDLHAATKKYADDNASAGAAGEYVCDVGGLAANGTEGIDVGHVMLLKGTVEALGWSNVEIGSDDQYDHDRDPYHLICKSAGDYLIYGWTQVRYVDWTIGAYYYPYSWTVDLQLNDVNLIEGVLGGYVNNPPSNPDYTCKSFAIIRTLAENDEVSLYSTCLEDGSGWESDYQDTFLGFIKVG